METNEMHHSTELRTQTTTGEPPPVYNGNGEEANKSPLPSDLQAAAPGPTPVTARRAYRGRLWEKGILVFVGESDSYIVGPIDEDLTTESIHSNPRREPEEIRLRPEQEVVCVPYGPEGADAEFSPVRVYRRRTIVRVRPDTATRYGDLYRLLSAAECIPVAVGEDLDRLTWALVYGSIPAAKKAGRILQEARRLVAG